VETGGFFWGDLLEQVKISAAWQPAIEDLTIAQDSRAMHANQNRTRGRSMEFANSIRRSSLFILSAALLTTSAIAQDNKPASPAEQEIMSVARARANSLTNNECDKWASYVADDFQDIEGGGAESRDQLLNGCRRAAHSTSECKSERALSDFHFQFVRNFAFVHYQYGITEHCGYLSWPSNHRQVDTYEKRNGKWIALYAVEVGIPQDPPVAKIDPAILDDYTGQYAWEGAHRVDTVTRKGDKLFIQATGDDAPFELVPQSADSFFIRGALDRNTFIRDASGKVVENRGYDADAGPTAPAYRAKKIK
jgi:hypothetical protein